MHLIITQSFNSDFKGILFLPSAQMKYFTQSSSKLKYFKIIEHPRTVIPSIFHFSKQFLFANEIDEKIGIFQSAGLIKFWTDLEIHHFHKVNEIVAPTKLTFKHVQVLFDFLIVGLFISFIAFSLELIYERLVGRQKVLQKPTLKSIRTKSFP